MRKWATQSPIMAGMVLVLVGFIVLFLAWNGASRVDHIQGQFPYLLSGGLVGIGLIGAGLTVVNVQTRRADQAELLNRLEAMLEARDTAEAAPPPADPRGRTRKLRAAGTRKSA